MKYRKCHFEIAHNKAVMLKCQAHLDIKYCSCYSDFEAARPTKQFLRI